MLLIFVNRLGCSHFCSHSNSVLSSVVKHLGRSRAVKKQEETLDYVLRVSFVFYRLLSLQQNEVQSRLFNLLYIACNFFFSEESSKIKCKVPMMLNENCR